MRLLLDTHTFLWFISGNDQLSKKAQGLSGSIALVSGLEIQ
jgi:PIN domain nuclease of toxin-antitoxin system